MNYLVINTSTSFEVLLLKDDEEFYFSSSEKRMASSELFPKIKELLSQASLSLCDIDCFGCVIGPGSFTGIRVGVSAIRGICYALSKPCVAITAFDLLAYNNTAAKSAIIDGGGGVCYLKNFNSCDEPICIRYEDVESHAKGPIISFDSFLEKAIITAEGDLKTAFSSQITAEGNLKTAFSSQIDRAGDYTLLEPLYLRRPQAERQAGEL